ncbi:MAG: arsenate reductase (glutaredoxin) [Gammaproteobacteria bacterium]|nr:arsenate reductase (glutaredoxin) [Gammaproteobacteria bacterium]
MLVVIYHNPRCSKSRETLQLVLSKAPEPQVVEYLKTPPTAQEIKKILGLLGMASPRELMRTKEDVYKQLKLDDPKLSEAQLISAMVQNPVLIERPLVVVDGKRAAVGRPPENVLHVL